MSVQETPHLTALKKQWQLQAKAKRRVRITGGKAEVYDAAPPVQDLETTLAAAKRANPEIGQLVEDHGIFFGTWEPKDANGKSLGKIFNLFAAPTDLADEAGNKQLYTYAGAAHRTAALKNWHGHDGASCTNDEELYRAIKSGDYNGGWFIPPHELLVGTKATWGNDIRVTVQTDNLFAHRNKGAFTGTFSTIATPGNKEEWYWAAADLPFTADAGTWLVRFTDGIARLSFDNNIPFSCRPIRLELKS